MSKKSCKALTLVISGLLVLCALYLLNKYVFKINENFQTVEEESQPEERQEEEIQPEEIQPEEEIQPLPPQEGQQQNMSYILINKNSPNQELNCGLDPTDDSKYLCQIASPPPPPPPMPNTPPDSAYPTPPSM